MKRISYLRVGSVQDADPTPKYVTELLITPASKLINRFNYHHYGYGSSLPQSLSLCFSLDCAGL